MRFIKGSMGEVTVTAVIANTVGRRLRTPAGSRYEVVQSWGDCCKWTVIRAEFGCLPVSIHLVFGCRFDAYSEDTVFDCLVFFRILAEMDSPPRCLGMLYTGQITLKERCRKSTVRCQEFLESRQMDWVYTYFILCVCNHGGQRSAMLSVGGNR